MNSSDDAKYRLRIAVGFCDEAERNFSRREWRACVDGAQLAVENAAKTLISCFHPAARTHEPEKELQDILDTHKNLPADVMAAISTVIACCQALGWEEHVRTDYGDELTRRTPWELFGEPEATNALQKAREAIQNAEHVVEYFCPTQPPSPAPGCRMSKTTVIIPAGNIVTHEIQSAAIAKNSMGISSLRRVLVYLPDGYEQENQRYPVIYWLPGWGTTATDEYRQPLDDAIKMGRIPPTIAVFIDAVTETAGTIYLNSPVFGNWEDFLTLEVVPFIDKTYRTIPNAGKRGLMGSSVGGYAALELPVLHPNIWGAVGVSDPSLWMMWYSIRKEEDWPKELRQPLAKTDWFAWIRSLFKQLPANLESYSSVVDSKGDSNVQILAQLGTAISPNPNQPLFADFPLTPEGEWVLAVCEKWRAYDLTNPTTIDKHLTTLKNLSSITIIVPEKNADESGRVEDIDLIERWKAAGISVTRLDMPGGHSDFRVERFIALAEEVVNAMERCSK